MIYETIMHGIKCNRCHETFENSDGYTLMTDKCDIEEDAQQADWHIDGDAHFCPNCYAMDDNDVITIKPQIHHPFFKFWNILKTLTGNLHRFSETETHYILSNRYCYKRLNNARLSILREVIANYEVEYKTPEKPNGQPYEIEIIRIPKNFKAQ